MQHLSVMVPYSSESTDQHFPVVLFIMFYRMTLTKPILWMYKSYSLTIQINATEQHFPVVLFVMFYKMTLTKPILWMHKSYSLTIQLKATDQHFPVIPFITLFDGLWTKYSSVTIQMERAVLLFCGTVHCVVQRTCNLRVCG